jgi:hypothetical protein
VTVEKDQIILIGVLPRTVRQACLKAAKTAGIIPAVLFRTGRSNLAVVCENFERTLYIRWPGMQLSRLSWTFDPTMFSTRHKATVKRAIAELLADQETPIRRIRLCGKTDPAVS